MDQQALQSLLRSFLGQVKHDVTGVKKSKWWHLKTKEFLANNHEDPLVDTHQNIL